MQATIASKGWFMQTTSWTEPSKGTVTTAGRRTTGDTSSAKPGSGAGITVTAGGTSTNIAGTINGTGTITIMTAIGIRN